VLLVIGNACRDIGYRLDHLPAAGETINALAVTDDLGGKGLNQAMAARRAGAEVRFVAVVGDDDTGGLVGALLAREGISAELVVRPGRSDHSLVMGDPQGNNMIVSDVAAARSLTASDLLPRLALGPGDALLMQGNLTAKTTNATARAARAAGAAVIINPAPFSRELVALGEAVDVLVLNAVEAAQWTGEAEAEAALAALPSRIALVTLGAAGCLLRDSRSAQHVLQAPRRPAADTTGAGDTFTGTFAAEWLMCGNEYRAARLAVAVASEKVIRHGTASALPARADVDRLRQTLRTG
jgi:ribokinase